MTKIAGSKLHMLLASEQEYKWAMKGSRTADSKGQSCIRVLRWSTRSCARVGALSNMRTLNHTYIYTSTEAMVESGNRFTLRRPRYSELNSSPKKEPTQVPQQPPILMFYRLLSSYKTVNSTRVSPAGITNHLFSMRRREIKIERKETILIASKTFLRFLRPVRYVDAIFFYIKVILVWPDNRLDAISRPWIIGPFGETTKKKWTITPRVTFLDVLM